jgi:hypothetical protein
MWGFLMYECENDVKMCGYADVRMKKGCADVQMKK